MSQRGGRLELQRERLTAKDARLAGDDLIRCQAQTREAVFAQYPSQRSRLGQYEYRAKGEINPTDSLVIGRLGTPAQQPGTQIKLVPSVKPQLPGAKFPQGFCGQSNAVVHCHSCCARC